MSVIRNIVFDVGNVFVRWSPPHVIERCFGIPRDAPENGERAHALFGGSPIWMAVNRGELTRAQAERAYCADHQLTPEQSQALFFHAMDHQVAIEGTEDLALRLKQAGYGVFGLTDNVREVMAHSRTRHRFWALFDGLTASPDVGVLKPNPRIYEHLLTNNGLTASESVFLDDVERNIEGAKAAGLEGFVFTTAEAAERDLRSLGLTF